MERIGTRSVALSVIRGFLGFFSTSTSKLTLQCLLRGLSFSLWSIMLNLDSNLQLLKVDRLLFGNAKMVKINERFLSTMIAQGKFRESFDPRSQPLSGEESTWKGDRLEIPRIVDCFFFITPLTCFGCFTTDVLFCQASVKIKLSTLSVHFCITFFVSST